MRFRAGLALIYPLLIGTTLAMGVLVNSGCGGGSSSPAPTPSPTGSPSASPTPTPAPVAVKATVDWGPRSRTIGAPSSALSGTLTLTDPKTNQKVLEKTVDRSVQAGQETYTFDAPLLTPGVYNLDARFFAQRGGAGDLVATAGASTTVRSDGTLVTTIAFIGIITAVEIPTGQVVNVGETKTVLYSAKAANGTVIAVTPGSAVVTITNAASTVPGQASAVVSGEDLTGQAPAKVTVTVKVDNATSQPADIAIRSRTQVSIAPNGVTVSIVLPQQFTADVANAPEGMGGVTWSLQEAPTDAASIDPSTGLFAATRTEGTFHVVATSVYDPNVSAVVPVTVQSQVAVTINPADPTVSIRGKQSFTAAVSSVPEGQDASVDWAVVGGAANGAITSDGVYTAPATPGDYQITATSRFDPRKAVTVTVKVRDGSLPVIVQ